VSAGEATGRRDPGTTRSWLRTGTERLETLVAGLDDAGARAPSLLPGWTRGHVVAHVARNAEAIGRLVRWARTGEETPMYASPAERDAEIERTAHRPAAALLDDLRGTAAALDHALAGLALDAVWSREVRVRQGAVVPAALLPWLRVREVWLHAADLALHGDPAVALSGAPDGLLPELLDDVTRTLSRDDDCPAARLAATDATGTWTLGAGDGPTVRGSAAELVLWCAGRGPGHLGTDDGGPLPVLPAWL
jgi:maleylpyruvate isomerase